jgi:hypothetical protein
MAEKELRVGPVAASKQWIAAPPQHVFAPKADELRAVRRMAVHDAQRDQHAR